MGRWSAVALGTVLATFLLGAPAQAQTPRITVILGSPLIQGEGFTNGDEVKATLRSAAGAVKGACLARVYEQGNFSCAWGDGLFLLTEVLPPATNEPGDRLTVERGGETFASGPLTAVRLTLLDPGGDRVGGRLVPRRPLARVRVSPRERLTATCFVRPDAFVKEGATAADGTFLVDLTSVGNVLRNDRVFVGAVQGSFEVGTLAAFPGLTIQKDTPLGFLEGIPGTTRTVRLYGPGGRLKSTATVTLGNGYGPAGDAAPGRKAAPVMRGTGTAFSFKGAAGQPVPMRQGDRIVVEGPNRFVVRVPRLSPDITAERYSVQTLPNLPLNFSTITYGPGNTQTYQSGFGQADAGGLFVVDPAAEILPYSRITVQARVSGNFVATSRMLAP